MATPASSVSLVGRGEGRAASQRRGINGRRPGLTEIESQGLVSKAVLRLRAESGVERRAGGPLKTARRTGFLAAANNSPYGHSAAMPGKLLPGGNSGIPGTEFRGQEFQIHITKLLARFEESAILGAW